MWRSSGELGALGPSSIKTTPSHLDDKPLIMSCQAGVFERVEAGLGPDSAWQEATNRKGTMEPIQLTLAPQDDFLLAAGVGRVSTEEVLRVLTTVIDAGTEQGFDKILLDFSAVMGELSVLNLYAVAKAMADYCVSKSIHPKLAVIGKPPAVTGFGAEVASNRGLTSKTFSDSQSALNWLRAFGQKGSGVVTTLRPRSASR
jgi:hypothetical protein